MSEYAINKHCDECSAGERGLVEIKIGKHIIMLCHECMEKFCDDMKLFKEMNY